MKATLRALLLLAATSPALADLSANVGYASEYHFRGILQKVSSANGGVDYEAHGFYVGSWAADVGDGLEVDAYFGYGGEIDGIRYSVGYTGYFYTGDFDDTYEEINLGTGVGPVSLDFAVGRYDNFGGPTLDYTHYALTLEKNGFHATAAGFARDADGEYLELGYATTLADIDMGVTLIVTNDDLPGGGGESIVFSLGKSFDL